MVLVYVPRWVASDQWIEIATELGNRSKFPSHIQTQPDLKIPANDLIHAAILSGRPSHLLASDNSSFNQRFAQWRVTSALWLLEPVSNKGTGKYTLTRPDTFFTNEIDPTEKAHLNYALGGTLTHAYLTHQLGVMWLAHYSLLTKTNGVQVTKSSTSGRVEPDYLGVDPSGNYCVAESKGRVINSKRIGVRGGVKKVGVENELDAKRQTGTVTSINAYRPSGLYGVAATSYRDQVSLYVTDPEAEVETPPQTSWVRAYYQFIDQISAYRSPGAAPVIDDWIPVSFELPEPVSNWANDLSENSRVDFEQWRQLRETVVSEFNRDAVTIFPDLTVVRILAGP